LAILGQALLDILEDKGVSWEDVETALRLVHRYPSLSARLSKMTPAERKAWAKRIVKGMGRE